jgi:hypothetical protein
VKSLPYVNFFHVQIVTILTIFLEIVSCLFVFDLSTIVIKYVNDVYILRPRFLCE